MKRLAILIVTENLNVGGAEKYTVLLANELSARGYRIVVLANEGPFRKHFSSDVIFVRAHFERGLLGVVLGVLQMVWIALRYGVALIHAQKLESAQAAWVAGLITGLPVVKTVHGYTPKELERLGVRINRYADKLIVVVDWLVEELVKNGVSKDKIEVIYNGTAPFVPPLSEADCVALKRSLGLEQRKIILSMARLERGKNYAALIEWFPLVLTKIPDAALVILGSGPEKQNLIQETRDLGLGDRVVFVEATTEPAQYLQIADVFCTPTIGRGMAVLEAMAAGLPVVGIEPIGTPRVIEDGVTGFLVPAGEGTLFDERVATLLSDRDLARRFGAAGAARVQTYFSLARMVGEVVAVYHKLL